jgi:hypothetical protein
MRLIAKPTTGCGPELRIAAAELRLALHIVLGLAKQGVTGGEEWNAANLQQDKAVSAWRLALRKSRVPL